MYVSENCVATDRIRENRGRNNATGVHLTDHVRCEYMNQLGTAASAFRRTRLKGQFTQEE